MARGISGLYSTLRRLDQSRLNRRVIIAVVFSLVLGAIGVIAALGADPLADLRDLHKAGGIAASEWATTTPAIFADPSVGFDFPWHVAQTAGHRFVPSLFVPPYDPAADDLSKAGCWARILASTNIPNLQFLSGKNLPICLRHNNIADEFVRRGGRYRLPLTEDNRQRSALVWRIVNGALDDTPQADVLGPSGNWTAEGALVGGSNYLRIVQAACPNPAWVLFSSNNEQQIFDALWLLANPGPLDPATGCYLNPTWKTSAEIAAVSLRNLDWLKVNPEATVNDLFVTHATKRAALHMAYFVSLKSKLSAAWSQNFRTSAYRSGDNQLYPIPPAIRDIIGPSMQGRCFDAVGSQFYLGHYLSADLTDPVHLARSTAWQTQWEFYRSKNPAAFREVFLTIGPDDAIRGAQLGKHEVITPERYSAYNEWLAWQCRAANGGVAVLLRHWCDAKTLRKGDFFPDSIKPQLQALGHPELGTLTNEDYVQAVISVPDRIMADATRDYWLRGETVPVTYTAGPQPAWFSAVKMPDGAMLIYGFSPVSNPGKFTVNVQGIGAVPFDFKGACRKYQLGTQVGYQWSDL